MKLLIWCVVAAVLGFALAMAQHMLLMRALGW